MKNNQIDKTLTELFAQGTSEIHAPEYLKQKAAQYQYAAQNRSKAKRPRKRSMVIVTAFMLCAVMLISAGVALSNIYVPGVGFVTGGGYEVYRLNETMAIGNKTIEGVIRIDNENMKSLSVVLSTTSEYGLPDSVRAILPDGTDLQLSAVSDDIYDSFGYGQKDDNPKEYFGTKRYYSENFPDVNTFTLLDADQSAEIALSKVEDKEITTNFDNGIRITLLNLTGDSKIFTYFVENMNMSDVPFHNNDEQYTFLGLGSMWSGSFDAVFTDENGVEYYKSNSTIMNHSENFESIFMLNDIPTGKIKSVEIKTVNISYCYKNDETYYPTGMKIQLPPVGEMIEYPDGLTIYDDYGLSVKIKNLKNQGKQIVAEMMTPYVTYTGENSEFIDNVYIHFHNSGASYSSREGTIYFYPDNYPEAQTEFDLNINSISYDVHGNWKLEY